MKHSDNKIIIIGVFFAATALPVAYLLAARWHISVPVAFFWVAIGLMVSSLARALKSLQPIFPLSEVCADQI